MTGPAMNTPLTLAGFAVGLAAVFGAALGVGHLVGPVGPSEVADPGGEATMEHAETPDSSTGAAPELPGGLMTTQDGYTFALTQRELPAGEETPVRFRILGPDGDPVTRYDESHDEDLHLIAVRRDLSGFQHVHPDLDADGTWHVPLALNPGQWRLFADFVPSGHAGLTLGTDLAVAGEYVPEPPPEPYRTAEVDGYTVSLDGELVPGSESELILTVTRDGRPVTDLQPYLAAYGHLVVLRDGDLAYLHVHPAGEPGDGVTAAGPDITFFTTAPSAGAYRLFLDFRHGDVVRTAEFTAVAGGASAVPAGAPAPAHDEAAPHGHGG
jgi:hypothetical protein